MQEKYIRDCNGEEVFFKECETTCCRCCDEVYSCGSECCDIEDCDYR